MPLSSHFDFRNFFPLYLFFSLLEDKQNKVSENNFPDDTQRFRREEKGNYQIERFITCVKHFGKHPIRMGFFNECRPCRKNYQS